MNEAPILNLHLDEDFNTSAFVDDTPAANNATCSGATCPAAGAKGQMREAPIFDGTQILAISNAAEIDALSNQFSIMAWIKPTDVVGHHRIVAHSRTNGGNGFGFGVKDSSLAFTTWGIKEYFSTADIAANYWQHVAVVFDENNDAHFYLNGALVDTITGSAPINLNTDGDPILIGGATPVGANTLIETFAGQIDELALYGASLTSAEIRAIFDYQNEWYDTKSEHPIVIDADSPVITLDVYTAVPLADRLIGLQAIDVTSYVDEVSVTIVAPDNSSSVQTAVSSGDAWIISFSPTMAGDYKFSVEATDAVGNKGYLVDQIVTVDNTPPNLTISAFNSVQPVTNTITIQGTATDALSSVAADSINIELFDWQNLSVDGVHNATYDGVNWSVDYPFSVPPYGRYQIVASAEDNAGNTAVVSAIVEVDGYGPFAGIFAPAGVLTQSGTLLSGVFSDNMYPQQGKLLHLPFETQSGAQPLLDVSPSGFAASCSSCPNTGEAGYGGSTSVLFDGSDDALTIDPNELLEVTDATFMAWVAPTWSAGTMGYAPMLLALDDGANSGVRLQIADDRQSLILSSGAVSDAIPMDITGVEWHHLAVALESDVWTAYLDGAPMGTITQTLSITTGLSLHIGASGSGTDFYMGYLD
ncbi:MAG: hypothetical protein GY943_28805, partial [Chloroflexi bacterium]|nr:hypothetical protein [Chloroflexota bacterium]